MGISRQSMGDQYGIAAVGIESSGGFVPYINLLEFPSAIKLKRRLQTEILRDSYQCSLLFDFLPPVV